MKLKSFGCSFIFGSDLADDGFGGPYATPSKFSWPALVAKDLGYQYECYARPGSGNLQIWEKLINSLIDPEPALYVIGWTWIDRFDYIKADSKPWPDNGARWSTIMPVDTTNLAKTYYKELHSEHRDKINSLITVKSAIDLLTQHNQPFIMTNMDSLLLDQRWNVSPGMRPIQDYVSSYLKSFDGHNMLDYSRSKGYKISETWHPLEEAHRDLADCVIQDLDYYVSGAIPHKV